VESLPSLIVAARRLMGVVAHRRVQSLTPTHLLLWALNPTMQMVASSWRASALSHPMAPSMVHIIDGTPTRIDVAVLVTGHRASPVLLQIIITSSTAMGMLTGIQKMWTS
jgi:hypothetical protein